MRILVTGARGMLGSDLCPVMRERHHEVLATDIPEMDVRDPVQVREQVRGYAPEVVIHLAAMTDVDGCERTPDEAYRTNAIGTQNVALACLQSGATLVYVSTISVFDGLSAVPYTEFDLPNPQSAYSRAKYQGERIAESLVPRHYIVRAGWMFGGGPQDKKFVAKILDLACSRPELKAVDDKFGSPTYTVDLARGIAHLLETDLYGLYHMVNRNACISRYEFARTILQYAGIQNCRVSAVSSAEFPLAAPRPRMEAARNYHLELLGLNWMPDWRSALYTYLEHLREQGEQRIVLSPEPVLAEA